MVIDGRSALPLATAGTQEFVLKKKKNCRSFSYRIMEKLVRIKSQGALQQRNWTKQNGETVVISSVELTMTDGIDTFVGEVTDQKAIAISQQPLDQNRMYGVRCKLEVREWKSEKSGELLHANSIKVINIEGV